MIFYDETEFYDNNAVAESGGAVAVGSEGRVVFRQESYFTGNYAMDNQGGAVYTEGSMVFRKNSLFSSNAAWGEMRCVAMYAP